MRGVVGVGHGAEQNVEQSENNARSRVRGRVGVGRAGAEVLGVRGGGAGAVGGDMSAVVFVSLLCVGAFVRV